MQHVVRPQGHARVTGVTAEIHALLEQPGAAVVRCMRAVAVSGGSRAMKFLTVDELVKVMPH